MKLNVAVIQQQAASLNKTENIESSTIFVRQAAQQGAQLVLLQELHTTAYFCQTQNPSTFDLAEPLNGPSRHALEALASELDIVLVGSIFEKRAAGIFHNTALVFDGKKGLVGLYRKMHIPDDPGFNEKYYFTPGDPTLNQQNAFAPIETSVGKLGILICWDQWYPEAARLSALQGAEILLYPTAIGWDPLDTSEEQQRQREAWTLIQRSHSVANHLPVIVANRTGFEAKTLDNSLTDTEQQDSKQQDSKQQEAKKQDTKPEGTQFWGQSFISGQQGDVLAMADTDFQGPLLATLDLARTDELRRIWPYFRDRRIDAYSGLLERYMES